VLRYDEFGRGFSDRPDKVYDASLYRQQLSELLGKLQIHSVCAIAGVSFGGPVVTDFAIHNPDLVSKVILVDPVYPEISRPPYPESIVQYKMATSPEDRVNGQWTDLKYPAHFPHWADQYKVQMQYKGFRNALVSTIFHYAPEGRVRANYQALDSLHKPVLLIWGKEDKTVPFKYSDSLRQILHTEYMPVDDAAHLPQMEKAGLVNEKIIAFLKS
jgi:pimeloyl-ACP methyl ester carboxylesterase